jgi:hypothetical protein
MPTQLDSMHSLKPYLGPQIIYATGIDNEISMTERFPCPCCACLSLSEKPLRTYQICPVCFWEDDPAQFADFAYRGGANNESLQEARENF